MQQPVSCDGMPARTQARSAQEMRQALENDLASRYGNYTYAAGSCIFAESDPGRTAFVIEKGYVEISRIEDGCKRVIATLGPGEVFGEIAAIDGRCRSATATALHDTALIPISAAQLEDALRTEHPLIQLLVRSTVDRLRGSRMQYPDARALEDEVGDEDPHLRQARESLAYRLRVQRALERAIVDSELALAFQPIVCLRTGRVAGFEALVRWPDGPPDCKSPAQFIPIAESSGVILALGQWVMERSLQALHRLQREAEQRLRLATPVFMSVNVSARQIEDSESVDRLCESIERSPVDPRHLKIEITERTLLAEGGASFSALWRLRETGVKLAMDDFGTGYSSLSYLHRFPLDVLKIDRAFTNSLGDGNNGRRIVNAILSLCRALEMEVVAEGIESLDELRWMMDHGCDFGQGFHLARPLTLADALVHLSHVYA